MANGYACATFVSWPWLLNGNNSQKTLALIGKSFTGKKKSCQFHHRSFKLLYD